MLRYAITLLLPAMLFLLAPAPASGQAYQPWRGPAPRAWAGDDLGGTYLNSSAGGYCYVYPRGRGYLFVNENGSQARFAVTSPGRLQMIAGEWDPNVVVTVTRDGYGRTVLRFDAPFTPTGYWVRAS